MSDAWWSLILFVAWLVGMLGMSWWLNWRDGL